MTDTISNHYLSEESVRVKSIVVIEQEGSMESLRLSLESDLAFSEGLSNHGLVGTYVNMIYGSGKTNKQAEKPVRRYLFGIFPMYFPSSFLNK